LARKFTSSMQAVSRKRASCKSRVSRRFSRAVFSRSRRRAQRSSKLSCARSQRPHARG
jgi:hypothetical protein